MTWATAASRTGPVYRATLAPIEPLGEGLLVRGERRRAAAYLAAQVATKRERGWVWMWESWMTTTDRECWK